MTRLLNEGGGRPPRLRLDLNVGTLWSLPPWSAGPSGADPQAQMRAVAAAGYEGVQDGVAAACRANGLALTGSGRILSAGELSPLIQAHQDAGLQATTLHVGTGLENDLEARRLAEAVLVTSQQARYPLFIETHRATITQDIRRTVDLVADLPDLRFNADLSHWYTGHELSYGDVDAKIAFMTPVLERVRFMHGRIGDSCAMQLGLIGREQAPFLTHFRKMWRRCFEGFLAEAGPGDVMVFAPELLPAEVTFGDQTYTLNYARRRRCADGDWREESDRWTEALRLCEIAKECFAEAERAVG